MNCNGELYCNVRVRRGGKLHGSGGRFGNSRRTDADGDRRGGIAAVAVFIQGHQAVPVTLARTHVEILKLPRAAGERIAHDHADVICRAAAEH